ncbi:beta-ketoacyl-[acyl-carrier-protein] synthase family protein [Natronobiforma cellulositropha]|uniref:beta-ketoacyl-[acyl-carrier-protein] synthase family protein n=1 Tax=Natronobiforma cellulositropha TaxID=1679076 RepID=UPI0021D59421|nr:beta-ketoacyl-[acyl-carrier-protein] synthase family protein [Natronobiforma cellulositropha]
MAPNDVVVTGIGSITPLGATADETWANLCEGVSATGPVTRFDPDSYQQCIDLACEIDADLDEHPNVNPRRMGRYTQYAVVAAAEALADAGLEPGGEAWTAERVGTNVGCGVGGFPEQGEAMADLYAGERLSPRYILQSIPNLASGYVSIEFDAGGPNRAPATACAAGTHAIAGAVDDVRLGRADVMLAGGTGGGVTPTSMAGFAALRALSTHTEPREEAVKPFDERRDGFVLSEGAGLLVLESRDHAAARGAEVIAELTGCGSSADASHPTKPREDGTGLSRAISSALEDAGCAPEAVDHVNAHATGTPHGDRHEARALANVFADVPPVSALKSMLGHALGGAGAIEAVAAVQTVRDGTIPPTINCQRSASDIDVPVVTETTETPVDVVVSNSAGFGGTNGVLVFESPTDA